MCFKLEAVNSKCYPDNEFLRKMGIVYSKSKSLFSSEIIIEPGNIAQDCTLMSDEFEPSIPVFYLDEVTKALFRKTRDLLDQILETFEILEDKNLMESIKEGEKDIIGGRVVSIEDYKAGKRSIDE